MPKLKKREKNKNDYGKLWIRLIPIEKTLLRLLTNNYKPRLMNLKQRLAGGETLDDLLPEAFAVVREADKRVLGLFPYDVQVMGGIVLHEGNLAEMKTGEGKTLTETMPVYLNALTGKGVHVITVNSYLSERDSHEMGPVFEWLGLSVGFNSDKQSPSQKRQAYQADITYTTNDELAFDYLRDNMVLYKNDQVQRGLNYAIVDEVDSILIDEARTPLIISGQAHSYGNLYQMADRFSKSLEKDDIVYDEETKTVSLAESGVKKANEFFGVTNMFSSDNYILAHYVEEGLKANYAMKRDDDYVVMDGQVLIVDQFTGRIMDGRRFSDGLHQALEAKENVEIQDANRTDASITYQNFFRMYHKLSGMTGTAATEAKEFYETYHMVVEKIPTNKPVKREDRPDVLYPTLNAKFNAVADLIEKVHKTGQPMLVGTVAVESSERLDEILNDRHVAHTVLNAKNHKKEAAIISQAGQKGAVTIATNMAGRGTDIKLGPGVKELGGLFVVGTEKHESRRIDNQLRGRAGRQGDPGVSQFFLSLEDELMVRFGSERAGKVRDDLVKDGKENVAIRSRIISRAVLAAQKRIEGNNYDERRNTLRYDDVLRLQREKIYGQRQEVISTKESLNDYLIPMFARTIDYNVNLFTDKKKQVNVNGLNHFAESILGVQNLDINGLQPKVIKEKLFDQVQQELATKEKALAHPSQLLEFEKVIILRAVDVNWKNNIDNMEQLRMSITLRGYGQHNPLVEYQNEAFEMYSRMIAEIEKNITQTFMRAEIRQAGA